MAFINKELIEDSPAAVLDALTQEVADALAHGWEAGIINGQTTDLATLDSTNQAQSPSALNPANGYSMGLRAYGLVTNAQSFSSPAA